MPPPPPPPLPPSRSTTRATQNTSNTTARPPPKYDEFPKKPSDASGSGNRPNRPNRSSRSNRLNGEVALRMVVAIEKIARKYGGTRAGSALAARMAGYPSLSARERLPIDLQLRKPDAFLDEIPFPVINGRRVNQNAYVDWDNPKVSDEPNGPSLVVPLTEEGKLVNKMIREVAAVFGKNNPEPVQPLRIDKANSNARERSRQAFEKLLADRNEYLLQQLSKTIRDVVTVASKVQDNHHVWTGFAPRPAATQTNINRWVKGYVDRVNPSGGVTDVISKMGALRTQLRSLSYEPLKKYVAWSEHPVATDLLQKYDAGLATIYEIQNELEELHSDKVGVRFRELQSSIKNGYEFAYPGIGVNTPLNKTTKALVLEQMISVYAAEMKEITKSLPFTVQEAAVKQVVKTTLSVASTSRNKSPPLPSTPSTRTKAAPPPPPPMRGMPRVPTQAAVAKVAQKAVTLAIEIKADTAKIKSAETKARLLKKKAARQTKVLLNLKRRFEVSRRKYQTTRETARQKISQMRVAAKKKKMTTDALKKATRRLMDRLNVVRKEHRVQEKALQKRITDAETKARNDNARYGVKAAALEKQVRALSRALQKKETALMKHRLMLKSLAFAASLASIPAFMLLRSTNINSLKKRMNAVTLENMLRDVPAVAPSSNVMARLPSVPSAMTVPSVGGPSALVPVPRQPNGFSPWLRNDSVSYYPTLIAVGALAAMSAGLKGLGSRLKKRANTIAREGSDQSWTAPNSTSRVTRNRGSGLSQVELNAYQNNVRRLAQMNLNLPSTSSRRVPSGYPGSALPWLPDWMKYPSKFDRKSPLYRESPVHYDHNTDKEQRNFVKAWYSKRRGR